MEDNSNGDRGSSSLKSLVDVKIVLATREITTKKTSNFNVIYRTTTCWLRPQPTFSRLRGRNDSLKISRSSDPSQQVCFEMGEYLLLMFCVAIGMMADFTKLAADGGMIIGFTALVLGTTIILHLIFSKLFKIDSDTVLITSTAAIYGPVFIGQIASAIRNRSLVFSGMATGLIGFAIGNYLGIAVAYFVRWLG